MASKNSSTPTKHSYDVHEIQTDDNATVHGCVVDLSPLKTSQRRENCHYFSGKLSDGIGRVSARKMKFKDDNSQYFFLEHKLNYTSSINFQPPEPFLYRVIII